MVARVVLALTSQPSSCKLARPIAAMERTPENVHACTNPFALSLTSSPIRPLREMVQQSTTNGKRDRPFTPAKALSLQHKRSGGPVSAARHVRFTQGVRSVHTVSAECKIATRRGGCQAPPVHLITTT